MGHSDATQLGIFYGSLHVITVMGKSNTFHKNEKY